MQVVVADPRCVRSRAIYRCALGTLPPGQAVEVPVWIRVLKDLPARRFGKIETEARARSAEIDPDPDNNFARQATLLLSRQPQLAFVVPERAENGRVR